MQTSPKLTDSTLPVPTNQTVALSAIHANPRNYNRHPARQIERIAASLATFGQPRSIVVWRSTILAGHGVVEAARSLGWTDLRADVLADEYPEHLALAYVVADNELSRLADPDEAALAQLLDEARAEDAGLLAAMGYSDQEFEMLIARVGPDLGPNDPAAEWRGMPEFQQDDAFGAVATIKVHFATEVALQEFSTLIGQNVNAKPKFIWYPKLERENLKVYQVQDEP